MSLITEKLPSGAIRTHQVSHALHNKLPRRVNVAGFNPNPGQLSSYIVGINCM